MASNSDDLEKELLRNLRLRRELGTQAAQAEDGLRRELTLRRINPGAGFWRERDGSDLSTLRLELKLRLKANPPTAKSDAGVQREQRQVRPVEAELYRPRRGLKVWGLVGLVCLVLSILVAVWLIYGKQ